MKNSRLVQESVRLNDQVEVSELARQELESSQIALHGRYTALQQSFDTIVQQNHEFSQDFTTQTQQLSGSLSQGDNRYNCNFLVLSM